MATPRPKEKTMQGDHFTIAFHVPGTLAANITMAWTAPFDCTLVHASANGSNANDGKLIIGNSSNDDAYLESAAIGDSDTPAEFDRSDFVGGECPHIVKGTVVYVYLDYDGAGGTATHDFTLVLTFSEG
jgi:hypothetical protein